MPYLRLPFTPDTMLCFILPFMTTNALCTFGIYIFYYESKKVHLSNKCMQIYTQVSTIWCYAVIGPI